MKEYLKTRIYTENAGLDIVVKLCIASPFSLQMANGNAGPISTLESMGAKRNAVTLLILL